MKGCVAWLTGLPGSGKTTIAVHAAEELRKRGYRVEVLDGDWVRRTINPDAGFTREERLTHLRRVAWIARLLARNGVVVLCSFVSPYKEARRMVREIIEEEVPFLEVYVKCSLEECIRRDPKGLYKKALKGEIPHFTGVTDPYEEPENPDLVLDTEKESVEDCAEKLLGKLEQLLAPVNINRGQGREPVSEDKVSVEIPRDLYEKAKKFIEEQGGFSSVEELVTFVLNELLSEEGESAGLSKEEEEKVKERLRALGYI